MRLHTLLGTILSLVLVVPTASPAKDLILRQRVTSGGPRDDTHESTQYWTGTRIVSDDPHVRAIIDLDAETMTILNKREHTYFTQTFADMRQQADAMNAEMKKRLENLPPEAREMMAKKGMVADTESAAAVTPTGKSEKIAGYDAKEYGISAGPMAGSVWATEALQPPGGTKAMEAFGKMLGGGPGLKFAQAMTQIKGVPLRTTLHSIMAPQGYSHTTEVVEVVEQTPPAEILTVPNDYKKIDPPQFNKDKSPPGNPPAAQP